MRLRLHAKAGSLSLSMCFFHKSPEILSHRHDSSSHRLGFNWKKPRYKSNVIELWWNNSKRSGELRRIIGDKEVIDMVAKLGKCKSVHVSAIDEHVKSLALPHVTYRFVDTSQVQNQREKAQLSTINGGNVKTKLNTKIREHSQMLGPSKEITNDEKNNHFVRWFKTRTSYHPISMEAQTQGQQAPINETRVEQTPIEAFESGPHAEAVMKENLIKSAINSENRAQFTMLPRTYSRPIRDVIYEDLDGKDGRSWALRRVFKGIRKKKDGTFEKEDDNILGESDENPFMVQFELVKKCFGA
ncbi:hypothetical protein Cgig2_007799 [Carnegiea gigantea]|uniref:Uncharacterized protein n=1 Tax=Carnegiea gigantea TaxID=171969 RepID=A0A9Q1GQR7_9CARY|nr:hypothetical protein Cgig2_007799 [Carnegiea gigantea]